MNRTLPKAEQNCSLFLPVLCYICIATVLFLPLTGYASSLNSEPKWVTVTQILTAKSFATESGDIVRLAGLQAPNITETSGKMRAGEPMGSQAKSALQQLILGKKLQLLLGPEPRDRHNRLVARAKMEDGTLVQQAMLQQGWAMAYWFADNRDWLAKLLPYEQEARAAKRGIWTHPYWQLKQADSVHYEKERYLIVEGTPLSIKEVRGNWYLNFGDDWKTDFTAMVKKDAYNRYFEGRDLRELTGQPVRLRGWLSRYNGPMLELLYPEQIEHP